MANQDNYAYRTAAALENPETPQERTLSTLIGTLNELATRYTDDSVMVHAVENLGSAIIVLLNDDTGRIDQAMADSMVRDAVGRAGGDPDEL